MKYPRYQNHRPSGIEWIREIPAGWKARQLRLCASIPNGQVDPSDERFAGMPLVGPEHIESRTGRIMDVESASTQEAISGKYLFAEDDVLFSKIRPELRKACYPRSRGLCSADVYPLRPAPDMNGGFLFHQLLSEGFSQEVILDSNRVAMPKVNRQTLGRIRLVVPPRDDQDAIAAFLDAKTAEIDTLIAKKERLVQLLGEKRAALITHAVTKGLDPGGPMKVSGSPLIGEIPKTWAMVKLGYLAQVLNGSTPLREEARYWDQSSFPWLTSGKVHEERIREADQHVSRDAVRECHLPFIPAGSVLVAITGEGKTRGTAALLEFESTISQHLAALIPGRRVRAEFLWRYLSSLYGWLRSESSGGGSTKAAITCEFLRSVSIALPPVEEQDLICAELTRRTADIDELRRKVRLAIDRLREYRTALISAAVTGKIDVRSLTPTAPCQ